MAAKAQDDRDYNARREARARASFKPLEQLTERQFKDRYRLSKRNFKILCKELRRLTNIRSTQRVSLEHKVCTRIMILGNGYLKFCYLLKSQEVL